MNTLFFGQKIKTFFTDLTDSEQKDIFRKVLQLDLYTDYYNYASSELKKISSEREEVVNRLRVKKTVIEEMGKSILREKEKASEFEKKKSENIESLERKISLLEKEVKDLQGIIESYDPDLDLSLSKEKEKESDLKSKIKLLTTEYESDVKDLKSKSQTEESNLQTKYLEMTSLINSKKTKLLEEVTNKYRNEISEIQEEFVSMSSTISTNAWKAQECKSRIESISKEIETMREAISKKEAVCYICGQKIGNQRKTES